jgi:hypothetical protein
MKAARMLRVAAKVPMLPVLIPGVQVRRFVKHLRLLPRGQNNLARDQKRRPKYCHSIGRTQPGAMPAINRIGRRHLH